MLTFDWTTPSLSLRFLAEEEGPLRLVDLVAGPAFARPADPAGYGRASQPLVEASGPQFGNEGGSHSLRGSGSHLGAALRHVGHSARNEGHDQVLEIEQVEPESGLRTVSTFTVRAGVAAARAPQPRRRCCRTGRRPSCGL